LKRFQRRRPIASGVGSLCATIAMTCGVVSAATIHPGDKVDVFVYNHPELSQQVIVSSTGRISIPLAGDVDVAGLEPTDAALRVRSRLAPFVKLPAVQIRTLAEGTQVVVDGFDGGAVPLSPGESLVGVISYLQKNAKTDTVSPSDLTNVAVKRNGRVIGQYDVAALQVHGQSGPTLLPNDIVSIRNKPVAVNVRGAVKSPGIQYVAPGSTIASVIRAAGGPTEAAAPSLTKVTQDGKETVVPLGAPASAQAVATGTTIDVPNAANVQVIGNVEHQGIVQLRQDNTLLSALYLSGGPSRFGDIRKVTVMRGTQNMVYNITSLQKGDVRQNPPLQDGDIVYVPENHKVDFGLLFQAINLGRTLRRF
jgi:protein involved in polysaccharide export with SLBB domain